MDIDTTVIDKEEFSPEKMRANYIDALRQADKNIYKTLNPVRSLLTTLN